MHMKTSLQTILYNQLLLNEIQALNKTSIQRDSFLIPLRKHSVATNSLPSLIQMLPISTSTNTSMNEKNTFRPRGYRTFFMLNSTEHRISNAHKTKVLKSKDFMYHSCQVWSKSSQ